MHVCQGLTNPGALMWVLETKLINGLVMAASMRAFTRPIHPTFNFAGESFSGLYFKGALPLPSQALAHIIAFALVEAQVACKNPTCNPSDFLNKGSQFDLGSMPMGFLSLFGERPNV